MSTRASSLALLITLLTLGGCGSTKVLTADKTLVYDGSVYNVSAVKEFSSKVEGTLPSGETISLKGVDKRQFNAYLDQGSPIDVRMIILLDERQVPYRTGPVDRYSEYDRMRDQFDRALKQLTKFLADKKDTQLVLD